MHKQRKTRRRGANTVQTHHRHSTAEHNQHSTGNTVPSSARDTNTLQSTTLAQRHTAEPREATHPLHTTTVWAWLNTVVLQRKKPRRG